MNRRGMPPSENEEQSSHIGEHLCLDLLQGFLSPEEERRVVAHLAACSRCEKLFRERASEEARLEATHVLVTAPGGEPAVERRGTAIREHGRAARDGRITDMLSDFATYLLSGFKKPRFQVAGGLAAAAAAVIVSFAVWDHYREPPGVQELHMLTPYSFDLEARETPESAIEENLKAGLEAYDEEDFKQAAELLDRAGVSELDEAHELVRTIYLGSALAWQGKHREAAAALEKVPFTLVPGEWAGEAQWTLYVAFRESGREASADSLVRILATKRGEVGDRARHLLNRQQGN